MSKLKYIVSGAIFIVGFVFYIGFSIVWQDNNTTYTLQECTSSQKEIIQNDIGVIFPKSTYISEIIYHSTWGNDVPRTYSIKLQMKETDYDSFDITGMKSLKLNGIQREKDDYQVHLYYTIPAYTPLATWMENNGKENMEYKISVMLLLLFFLIVFSILPLLPYKKILRSRV